MIGTTLSHYRITEELGAGGMGVVYRAEDTNLDRQVAIKMLPEKFTGDPERMARFEREAKLLASLNHPNVAAIHSLEQADGKRFLVLELVEGKTLAQRLAWGSLPIEETLQLCRQIAEGVEAAHEKGIVHRDLKPANVKITPEGKVKVLDFGLAKALVDDAPSVDLSHLPTISDPMTKAGTILGTIPYMSPEQARGMTADKRTDVWAFGCILFECLTGKRAFPGGTAVDTIASILGRDPDWDSLPLTTPETVQKLLKRCLNKNPQQRLHDIADARIDIEEELEARAEAVKHPADSPHQGAEERVPADRRRKRILVWCSLLAVAAAIPFGLWLYKRRNPSARSDRPPTVLTALVTWPSEESKSRISPDNKWISFISDRDGHSNIWLRSLDGTEPVQITKGSDTVTSQVWSPKGDEIAYLAREEKKAVIQIIPAFLGGPSRWSLSLQDSGARLVRWIGTHLYVESNEELQRVDLPARALTDVTHFSSGLVFPRDFDISPDEKRIVFTARLGLDDPEELWVSDLNGGNLERLTYDDLRKRFPAWMGRNDKIVYQSSEGGQIDLRAMFIQDKSRLEITSGGGSETPEDVSADGSTLTYKDLEETANLWLWNRATGVRHQITGETLSDFWPSYSGSGGILAFQRTKPTLRAGYTPFESQIFSGLLKAGKLEDVTMRAGDGYNPQLSPDGRWLAYQKWPPQSRIAELWVEEVGRRRILPVSDRCPVSPTTDFPLDVASVDFGWNGGALYFIGRTLQGIRQIRKFIPESGRTESEIIAATADKKHELRELRFSPDQRYLSYLVNSNDRKLFVRDLVSGEEKNVHTEPIAPRSNFYSRGWLDDHTMIALRSTTNPDLTYRVEIIAVDLSGKSNTLGAHPRAFPATARLNPAARELYMTAKEGVVQNVYVFHLADWKKRQLTDNELPSVTFSGIAVMTDNELVYTRHMCHGDIWMIRFQH